MNHRFQSSQKRSKDRITNIDHSLINDMVDTDGIRSAQYLFTKLQQCTGYVDADF